MYNIFKTDKHGIWLKNENEEVVLVENNLKHYTKSKLKKWLVSEGLQISEAINVVNEVEAIRV